MSTSIDTSSIGYNYSITNKFGNCEIYFDKGKNFVDPNINKQRFDKLCEHKKEIEEKFGSELSWERLDEKRASRIAVKIEGVGLNDKDKWKMLQNQMIDNMIKLEKATKNYIRQLK